MCFLFLTDDLISTVINMFNSHASPPAPGLLFMIMIRIGDKASDRVRVEL